VDAARYKILPPLSGIELKIFGSQTRSVAAILTELLSFPTDRRSRYKLEDNIKKSLRSVSPCIIVQFK